MLSHFNTSGALFSLAVSFFLQFYPLFGNAEEIDFEDAFAARGFEGQLDQPNQFYQTQGLIVNGDYFGLLTGVSNGDSGNFDLEGTNGPSSLAVNLLGQSIDLIFSSSLDKLCFDLGTSFFAQSPGNPDINLITYQSGVIKHNETITIVDTLRNGNGTWYTQYFSDVDRVTLTAQSGWRIWAIDNIRSNTSCIKPSVGEDSLCFPARTNSGFAMICL